MSDNKRGRGFGGKGYYIALVLCAAAIGITSYVYNQGREEPALQTANTPAAITGTVNAKSGLSVRKGAGTSYAIKRYLSNGTKVTITEQKNVKGTVWGKISDGWICMDYVKLNK